MKQNKLIFILIAVGLIGAGIWYFKPKAGPESGSGKAEEFSGTLVQAMKLGVPMKCQWQTNDSSGESYVKGEDMYVKMVTAGKTGYMIKKGKCIHSWEESTDQGVTFCQEDLPGASPAEAENLQPPAGDYQAQGVDWNVEYKCRPDMFEPNRFDLPAGIKFIDVAEMMRGFTPQVDQ